MFSQNLLLRENGRWIVKASLSSNNQWGIIKLPLPLSKLYIIVRANLPGNLAAVYLLTILLISISKYEAIFLALCNSPNNIVFVSHLDFWCPVYRELFDFIVHLSCNFAVSSNNLCIKEHGEFDSKVSFLFWWYEFNAWWSQYQFHSVFFWHMYHPHDACVISVSKFRFLKYK